MLRIRQTSCRSPQPNRGATTFAHASKSRHISIGTLAGTIATRLIPWCLALAATNSCRPRLPTAALRDTSDSVVEILAADQQTPIADGSTLAQQSAPLAALYQGLPLTARDEQILFDAAKTVFVDCRFSGVDTPLWLRVKAALRQKSLSFFKTAWSGWIDRGNYSRVSPEPSSPAWRNFAQLVHQADCFDVTLADVWPEMISPKRHFHFNSAAEVSNFQRFLRELAWTPQAAPANDSDAQFVQNFASALEFIDLFDLLFNMSPARAGQSAGWARQVRPLWELYDRDGAPMLVRWRRAIERAQGLAKPQPKDFYEPIAERRNFSYRQTRVVAGGDIAPQGAISWDRRTQFFRVNARQKMALERNPLLVSQFTADTASTSPNKTWLGQYEYPSARTWRRFSARLSAALIGKLQSAESSNQLSDESSETFKGLTAQIIDELVSSVTTSFTSTAANVSASYAYQTLMAIHPADDYNGRSLRAWFRYYESQRSALIPAVGVPLFLWNFDLDLYSMPEEFLEQTIIAERQWAKVLASFMNARNGNRLYFDQSLLWQVAADQDDLSAIDGSELIRRAKQWFSDSANSELVRQKRHDEVRRNLRVALFGRADD